MAIQVRECFQTPHLSGYDARNLLESFAFTAPVRPSSRPAHSMERFICGIMKIKLRNQNDMHLIHACLEGHSDAKTELYELYFRPDKPVHFWVYQKAYWIPAGEKEDILNDIYIAVIQSLPQFEFRSALSTYITRIAKIKCLDAMPSRLGVARGRGIKFVDIDWFASTNESGMQLEDTDPNNRPDRFLKVMEEEEQVFLLHTALKYYTGPRCRDVLKMYVRELKGEMSREDLANTMGVSVQRMGQMIYDCMYRLRRKMQSRYKDYEHFTNCVCEGIRHSKTRNKE